MKTSKVNIKKAQLYVDVEFDVFEISVLNQWNMNLEILILPYITEFPGQFHSRKYFIRFISSDGVPEFGSTKTLHGTVS